MAQLAIRGHETRGKEVIEILETLGYSNGRNYSADSDNIYFYGSKETNIIYYDWYEDEDMLIFTLEEFLERFPYKIGDKVLYKYDKKTYFIRKIFWKNDKILYELSDEVYSEGCSMSDTIIFDVDVIKLQPYKEETMEKSKVLKS